MKLANPWFTFEETKFLSSLQEYRSKRQREEEAILDRNCPFHKLGRTLCQIFERISAKRFFKSSEYIHAILIEFTFKATKHHAKNI